jgi:lysophospholipase L1-like esterase
MSASNKKIFLWLITLSLPYLVLGLIEIGLRLSGKFNHTPVFTTSTTNPNYKLFNPDIAKRYFDTELIGVKGERDPFLARKPQNTFRVVVQGESAVQGFPYGHSISFSRFLKQYLEQLMPDRNIEVINMGLTAISSHILLDMAREIPSIQPDLVVIYAGHNEYYGIFGAGSAYRFSGKSNFLSAYIYLRRFSLFRALGQLLGTGPSFSSAEEPQGTLMQAMAANKEIAFGDITYQAGLDQFRSNMGNILEIYRKAGLPVILAVPQSNLRSQPPFVSEAITSAEDLQSFTALSGSIKKAGGLDSTERRQLLKLYTKYPEHAGINYLMGLSVNRSTDALEYFISARDLDMLRFRANSDIANAIQELSTQYGAKMSNAYNALAQADGEGIPGDQIFAEHVHFNIQGNDVLARHLTSEIADLFEIKLPDDITPPIFNVLDSLLGEMNTYSLLRNWPFTLYSDLFPPDNEVVFDHPLIDMALDVQSRTTGYLQAGLAAMDFYLDRGDLQSAKGITRSIADEFPDQHFPILLHEVLLLATQSKTDSGKLKSLWLESTDNQKQRARLTAEKAGYKLNL